MADGSLSLLRSSGAHHLRLRLRVGAVSRPHTLAGLHVASTVLPPGIPAAAPHLWSLSCRRSGAGRGQVRERASEPMNMAFIGDADPFTAAIPATKVELTVSCRGGRSGEEQQNSGIHPLVSRAPAALSRQHKSQLEISQRLRGGAGISLPDSSSTSSCSSRESR
ncbi:hypothetical protein D4764_13G0007260 [Takifugu flavidus]|uniref:Uncharacterized protein n=1 Tax=Takifugu flavidus TaxID=433684 RepID=A0A5C6P8C7_9TELE|nr:hypothetical protein D4764_13G0007260 [Takifugu flavidus]